MGEYTKRGNVYGCIKIQTDGKPICCECADKCKRTVNDDNKFRRGQVGALPSGNVAVMLLMVLNVVVVADVLALEVLDVNFN